MAGERECRMFPLGSVLVPAAALPLHIFEPRYQQLLNDSLADDSTFGVVLISRGSEVGGGDVRTDLGTLTKIVEHRRFDDGRAAVLAVGLARIEIVEWLADDPYPRAIVRDRPSEPWRGADRSAIDKVAHQLRHYNLLAYDLGMLASRPAVREFHDDFDLATWELIAACPLADLDRQRLLGIDDAHERIGVVQAMMSEIVLDLHRLHGIDRE